MIPLFLTLGIVASSESLIILSNFLLTLATLLLFWASMHEQHATIKALITNENSLIQKIVRLLLKKQK